MKTTINKNTVAIFAAGTLPITYIALGGGETGRSGCGAGRRRWLGWVRAEVGGERAEAERDRGGD